jgi:Xaa-Pro aminopeptidase
MKNIEVLDGIDIKKIKCLNGKNKKLKKFLKEKIDGYIIPKNDEFFGEYIPDHNDRLKLYFNFSGSYGFA